MEETVFRGKVLETGIGEPIVQRSHPAALSAFAHEFGKTVDAGNISFVGTGDRNRVAVGIAFGSSFNNGAHHCGGIL